MDTILTNITEYMLKQSCQVAILFVVVAIVCLALKKKTAHLRYLLWLLILAKCLVPSVVTISLAILPQEPEPAPVAAPIEQPAMLPLTTTTPMEYTPLVPVVTPLPPQSSIIERLAEVMAQLSAKTYFALAWLAGLIVFSMAVIIKAVKINTRFTGARRRLGGNCKTWIDGFFAEFAPHSAPNVYLLEGIGQPFVWGLVKGSIYLPVNFAKTGSGDHRRKILAHELAHITRFDALVNALQVVAQGIFWFHPLVWWANKRIREEREKCCDETAIAKLSATPTDYSSAIVDTLVAEYNSTLPVPSLAIAGPVKNIEDRIKTIMKPGKKFQKRPTIIAILIILVMATVIVPTTIALTRRPAKTDVQIEVEKPAVEAEEKNIIPVTAPDKWTRILPDGDTIKLVALFRPKDNPTVFWNPHGTIIEGPKLARGDFANASGRQLAYVLQRPELKIEDGYEHPGPDGNFYDVHGWKTFQLESNEPLIIRRASGYGDWVDMGQIKEGEDLGNYNLTEIGEVAKGPLKQIRAKMFWKSNPEFGIRLVAIDKKDKEYPMEPSDTFIGNFRKGQQMLYYQAAMGLNKKELSHFKLQRRPLAWAEFSGFATEPKKPAVDVAGEIAVQSDVGAAENLRRRRVTGTTGEMETIPENSALINLDFLIAEPFTDSRVDWETCVQIKNLLLSERMTLDSAKRPFAADVLRIVARSQTGDKELSEDSLAGLIDLLSSKGYLTIMANPRILLFDGQTAKVSVEPAGEDTNLPANAIDKLSLEVTPKLKADKKAVFLDMTLELTTAVKDTGSPTLSVRTITSQILTGINKSLLIELAGAKTDASEKPIFILAKSTIVTRSNKTADQQKKAQVSIEARFMVVDENFLEDVGFNFKILDSDEPPKATVYIGTPTEGETTEEAFKMDGIDDLQIDLLIRAAQAHVNSKVLTAPKVTVVDGEEAEISVTKEIPYVTSFSESNDPSQPPEPNTETFIEGIQLKVLPRITDDNKHILLKIAFERCEILSSLKQMYKDKYPYELPIIEKITMDAQASVADKGTILLGGLKVTPVALGQPTGDAAISEAKGKQILLVLVKPTIVPRREPEPDAIAVME